MTALSATVGDKAARLFADARVRPAPDAQVFRVTGQHSTHTVVLEHRQQPSCTCRATSWACSHVGAAFLLKHERDLHDPVVLDDLLDRLR